MSLATTSGADGPPLGEKSAFHFVATSRPLIQGGIGAVVVLAGLLGWGWWSGRIQDFDATYAGVLLVSAGAAITFVTWRLWRSASTVASMLGHIELDGAGVRWHRKDGLLGFDTAWQEVEGGKIDARSSTLVLFRKNAAPIVIGVLSQHGVPHGFVVLEKFRDIVEFVGGRVPISPHEGSADAQSGRRTVLLGLGACVTAIALYGVNVLVGSLLAWNRWLIPLPAVVGAVGLLVLVAGTRVWTGKGPLVSPLYGAGYRATLVRFLVVASVANFALLAVANSVAR